MSLVVNTYFRVGHHCLGQKMFATMRLGPWSQKKTMLLVQYDEDNDMHAAWGPIALARLEHTLGIKEYPYHEDFDGGFPALGGHMIKVQG